MKCRITISFELYFIFFVLLVGASTCMEIFIWWFFNH